MKNIGTIIAPLSFHDLPLNHSDSYFAEPTLSCNKKTGCFFSIYQTSSLADLRITFSLQYLGVKDTGLYYEPWGNRQLRIWTVLLLPKKGNNKWWKHHCSFCKSVELCWTRWIESGAFVFYFSKSYGPPDRPGSVIWAYHFLGRHQSVARG